MKFDQPARTNPIDSCKIAGRPNDRIDGPLPDESAFEPIDLGVRVRGYPITLGEHRYRLSATA